jgi:hypothetical protein
MKGRVAVATVQGKAYYLIVDTLKKKDINFLSLIPGEILPSRVELVISTEKEKDKVSHPKILLLKDESELDCLIMEVEKLLSGKETYDKMVIGIDPGEAIGLAVLADGKVIEEANCFCSRELISNILKILRSVNFSKTNVTIRIGNGIPLYIELIHNLDEELPSQVKLEVVGEAGTNRPLKGHSRKIRHISSAIRIAGRTGRILERRKELAASSKDQ